MWIDRAVKWLLPREEHFFDLLEQGAARALEISALLAECCAADPAPTARRSSSGCTRSSTRPTA